jgi:hypothetical protein
VHMDLKGDTNVAIGLSSNAIAFFDKEPIWWNSISAETFLDIFMYTNG